MLPFEMRRRSSVKAKFFRKKLKLKMYAYLHQVKKKQQQTNIRLIFNEPQNMSAMFKFMRILIFFDVSTDCSQQLHCFISIVFLKSDSPHCSF